jgi:hypothetical protein
MDDREYKCRKCGTLVSVPAGGTADPAHCGEPMLRVFPLEACTRPMQSEHARNRDLDEPCDDGRAGFRDAHGDA